MNKKNKKDSSTMSLSATDDTSTASTSATEKQFPLRSVEKNTAYTVISIMNHLNQFTEIVNNLLKEGWQLQGGVSTSHVSNDYNVCVVYSQALIKIS